jgi:uncharacterized protein (DUF2062 family)
MYLFPIGLFRESPSPWETLSQTERRDRLAASIEDHLPIMIQIRDLIKKLLHIEDTPERTALAYAIGVFLGFSPFLGLHTLVGLAIAFIFRLNRMAILLGIWSNTPWWIVPYYMIATWVGMWITGFWVDWATLKKFFQIGVDKGFMDSDFWSRIISQWGLLLSIGIGSLILCTLLSLIAYPLSLKFIKFYRTRKKSMV